MGTGASHTSGTRTRWEAQRGVQALTRSARAAGSAVCIASNLFADALWPAIEESHGNDADRALASLLALDLVLHRLLCVLRSCMDTVA